METSAYPPWDTVAQSELMQLEMESEGLPAGLSPHSRGSLTPVQPEWMAEKTACNQSAFQHEVRLALKVFVHTPSLSLLLSFLLFLKFAKFVHT